MDENLMDAICREFGLEAKDANSYSPLTLAYIGDGIFELVIRTVMISRHDTSTNRLHKKASRIVNAGFQAKLADKLKPHLTNEEKDIFRRGRNAKSHSIAKNATVHDYRIATGFEALMGYLYVSGKTDRLIELVRIGLEEEVEK